MAGTVRVGMSGFSYPEWVGTFYPTGTKRSDFLAHYATRFGAVEINMTFRRNPAEKTLVKWLEAVPEGFRFAFKAHQRITHSKRLKGADEAVEVFVRSARVLGERLGPVLFQTPPSLAFDAPVLDAFCAHLPPAVPYAFEPRHDSFEAPDAWRLLERHRIARCLNDDLAHPDGYRVTGPVAYFRFRREDYSDAELDSRAGRLRELSGQGVDVYAFFKHEDRPEAVEQALAFQERVAE